MAYIRAHETSQKRKGRAVKRYEVVWREPVRDDYGLPVPVDPANPSGKSKTRARQESFTTREDAEARRDELNAAKHSGQTSALAEQKKAGDLPFGYYAQAWIESQRVKVSQGRLKQRTLDDYEKVLRRYSLERFGGQAVASVSPRDCEHFLADLAARNLAPKTVKHAWLVLRAVLKYATRHGAIPVSPTEQVDFSTGHAVGDREAFQHHPLTAEQIAATARIVGERYPVYELLAYFLPYSGLRKAECAGLEIQDLEFTTRPGPDVFGTTLCVVHVRRTKDRKGGQWVTSTPKSRKSRRSVPLPPWLAERMRAYVAEHPRAEEPTAPLWPSRKNGGRRVKGERTVAELDWSQPSELGTWFETILAPALVESGLPVSCPARNGQPAQRGVRLHDYSRHTFATMQLSAGVHFMQVSQWLGHAHYSLTLDTYGDWIPSEDGGALNNLPEPTPVPESAVPEPSNVIQLFGR
ncbi:phage integrase [Gordonia polyisoprenivorans VH2]|uniref:Phage integrase n=1 Tax=Gordonia polyisoprenivorans (strain DSM 44266 / VH2) TaxID=1112204 RepID=H6MQY2_GORPV|nr:phage integrase N-terminal SAM-like domain-containing protein [Gordonia polyisoprenivorans]AFA73679.1 phage integrase [Gordonia polyisoprenivorans VH2]